MRLKVGKKHPVYVGWKSVVRDGEGRRFVNLACGHEIPLPRQAVDPYDRFICRECTAGKPAPVAQPEEMENPATQAPAQL